MSEEMPYLERHGEPRREEQNIPPSLLEKYPNTTEKTNETLIEKNGITARITYEGEDSAQEVMSDHGFESDPVIYGDWRILNGLVIRDLEGKQLLNLNSLLKPKLEEGWRSSRKITAIFPNEVKKDNNPVQAFAELEMEKAEQGLILLTSRIDSPITLISLLHELGHIVNSNAQKLHDVARYQAYSRTLIKTFLTSEEINLKHEDLWEKISETILENERTAWAYALNKMRPLVRAGFIEKDELLKFIHQKALQGYSNTLQTRSNPNIKEKMEIKFKSLLFNFALEVAKWMNKKSQENLEKKLARSKTEGDIRNKRTVLGKSVTLEDFED